MSWYIIWKSNTQAGRQRFLGTKQRKFFRRPRYHYGRI